jgi:Fe2+ or Zn2+ uptake regulation protein
MNRALFDCKDSEHGMIYCEGCGVILNIEIVVNHIGHDGFYQCNCGLPITSVECNPTDGVCPNGEELMVLKL